MTLALNATHPSNNATQYDTHNLFGHMESKITHETLSEMAEFNDTRQFLLSRSTFAGSGAFTSHWLGDNHRSWDDMIHSIAGVMNFNMFGIPHVGADVCGFFENLDKNVSTAEQQEICGRWYQLSTFYPFARNHRDKDQGRGGFSTEPYSLTDPYKAMAIDSIKERYKYLMFLYTCMFSTKDGNTCFDPMLFHYPDEEEAYNNIEQNFIVGDALKVSPVTWA